MMLFEQFAFRLLPDPTGIQGMADEIGEPGLGHAVDHPVVIAFAGYIGAGKDTAAGFLKSFVADFVYDSENPEARLGVKATSFAAPLKELLKFVYNLSDNDVYGYEDRAARERPHPNMAGMSPRRAMQLIATEGFRHLVDDDTWVAHWYRNVYMLAKEENPKQVLYLTDFRFINEYEFLRAHCPNLIVYFIDRKPKTELQKFIDRWDVLNLTRRRSHDSERQIDELLRRNKNNPQWAVIDNRERSPLYGLPEYNNQEHQQRCLEWFEHNCHEIFVEDLAWRFIQ